MSVQATDLDPALDSVRGHHHWTNEQVLDDAVRVWEVIPGRNMGSNGRYWIESLVGTVSFNATTERIALEELHAALERTLARQRTEAGL